GQVPLDLDKARRRNRLQALSKLVTVARGHMRIVDNPPLVHHIPDQGLSESLRRLFGGYCQSLQDDRRALVERYRLVDFALKVVGVGSVGTRCYILLLDSSHQEDPLFLQIKEAQASVLEPDLGGSSHANHGQRVVNGQRLMQSASDMFLGWTSEGGRDYYVRQLRDMKGAADLEAMSGHLHWFATPPAHYGSRRDFLCRAGMGFGTLALAGLLERQGLRADDERQLHPLAPRPGHFPARAKGVIWLFINGGPSHVD